MAKETLDCPQAIQGMDHIPRPSTVQLRDWAGGPSLPQDSLSLCTDPCVSLGLSLNSVDHDVMAWRLPKVTASSNWT